MKKEHRDDQLLDKITENIRATAPRGRWYGRAMTATKVCLVLLFFFTATLAMSFFLYDFGEKKSMFEFTNSPFVENMTNFLFEFLVISLVGIGGIYTVYRQTDWPLVKERLWLFVGLFATVAGISVGLVIFSESTIDPWGDFIGETTHSITHMLPIRSGIEEGIENDMNENFYFSGTIITSTTSEDDTIITIQNDSSAKVFRISDSTGIFTPGMNVIVHYVDEQDGSEPLIKEIKRL